MRRIKRREMMRKLLPLRSSVHQAGFSNTEYQRAEEIVNTLNKASSRQDLTPQTVDKDPGSHSRIRVFVHNKFCNIVEILTFLVEFTV